MRAQCLFLYGHRALEKWTTVAVPTRFDVEHRKICKCLCDIGMLRTECWIALPDDQRTLEKRSRLLRLSQLVMKNSKIGQRLCNQRMIRAMFLLLFSL